ncbi:DUF3325 domain-containing protein [Luteimonas terricola]|uniref:DUF3325 domain-containing protein n=1 Tax=Luteimonas terricola TaxID=645597 RepID=A0ABQ2EHY9_9GAMM|nr:DUF3325 domain-containing protein [Luteimonas terricola]GGK10108.1 hypothetical protein GCM10011394_19440 [Luteimonas terricola]
MHDAAGAVWLLAAAACALSGMGWLALAMPGHAAQAWGGVSAPRSLRVLRRAGACALALALGGCLAADHASMAVLTWVMLLAASAAVTAFVLAWRPRWLRHLAPWIGAGNAGRRPAPRRAKL